MATDSTMSDQDGHESGTGATSRAVSEAGVSADLRRGWYLKCKQGDIAERVILVGDPGRVEVFAQQLEGPRTVNTNRSLVTVTGRYRGVPVTVAAFGMGAPIMAVVLEEVVWLGAKVVLRAGTAMSVAPGWYGRFIVADAAIRGESTSATYVPASYPAVADHHMSGTLSTVLGELGEEWGLGLMASYDGFYSELFALGTRRQVEVLALRARLCSLGVAATDMETSALFTVGRYLGVQCGSLCLVTVDGPTQSALEGREREEREAALVRAALEGATRCPIGEDNTAG
ncbi:MAG: nucleoside phosphorylase [Chloroflexota bacterium]